MLQGLASFARVAWFDKRGTGLSDKVSKLPTLEERMDDLRAVMDAAGFGRAAVFGISEGGSMSALFAATYPGRTSALVLYGAFAKRIHSSDYPWAPTLEERQKWIDLIESSWGGEVDLDTLAPSVAKDPSFRRRFAAYLRSSASPGAASALARMNTDIDIRNVLTSIHVPTLVIHRKGDRDVNVDNGRFLARQIPGAKFVELAGEDHLPWAGDTDSILAEVEEFLTGARPGPPSDRVLATVMFTDIVGSTKKANQLGDREWTRLLQQHNDMAQREILRFRGTVVKGTGDGFLATFDGPSRAILCAHEIRDRVQRLGIEVRTGLHTGECELMGNDVGGIAVNTASRIAAEAGSGEILVSNTVKDLVAGSGLAFTDRGLHSLKGLQGELHLFAVE
jgi:class 3 adenylate cyclase